MTDSKKMKDQNLDKILKVAENIRKMAEIEADEIIENARKRAVGIAKESVPIEEEDKSVIKKEKKNKQEKKQNGHTDNRICSADVFNVILERERSRSDRNGHELSLVIFDRTEEWNERLLNTLIKLLKKRSRSVDRFGWYQDTSIGIILPNTSYKGGAKFAQDVCELIIEKNITPPDFKVYSYPTSWLLRKNHKSKINEKKNKKRTPVFIDGVDPVFAKKIPYWKRNIDVIGSALTLIIVSPIFIFVPLLIKAVSPGPIFFKQDRVGRGGKLFTFLKFRTMKVHQDVSSHKNHLHELIKTDKPMTKLDKINDPRIIPLGRFIRKACIDELPQLINVLKGDMSLVGPRPCLPYEAKEYLKWHKYRFDIKPGMTGLWQVSGKNKLTFKEMIRLDIVYAKKMSFWKDLWILLLTIPTVVSVIIEKFTIDAFFKKIEKKQIKEEQFKKFIKRYYSDIYNVDKLEFLDDRLKKYKVDPMELIILLSKLNRLSPTYNVAKRYFGICKLIEVEKKSQSRIKTTSETTNQ